MRVLVLLFCLQVCLAARKRKPVDPQPQPFPLPPVPGPSSPSSVDPNVQRWLQANADAIPEGQRETSPDMKFDPTTDFTVPQVMFDFLERNNWGDFHTVFHLARKYYVIGPAGARYVDSLGVKAAPFQEGDPNNGLEFLTMHSAMIDYLTAKFGTLPVSNDPEGLRTIAEVLRGWDSDEKCMRGLPPRAQASFKRGLANVNNFAQFKTEDEFGLFIQTGMRLLSVSPTNPAQRQYQNDPRPGAGVHNWLHGQLMDDSSPITVGDPRTNLPNIMFWRIHGWIQWKWTQYQAFRQQQAGSRGNDWRTPIEKAMYDGFMALFRKHMASMDNTRSGRAPSSSRRLLGLGDSSGAVQAVRPRRRNIYARLAVAPVVAEEADSLMVNMATHLDALQVGTLQFGEVNDEQAQERPIRKARRSRLRKLAKSLRSRFFRNFVHRCSALMEGTITTNCFLGKRTRRAQSDAILVQYGANMNHPDLVDDNNVD